MPLVPLVDDVPLVPEVPDEPSPPLAPSRLTTHELYVPPPTVLVGAANIKVPVAPS